MEAKVLLTFKDGRKVTTSLSAPFNPEEKVVNVFLPDLSDKRSISLERLSYIGMLGPGGVVSEAQPDGHTKEVEVVTGERFLLCIGTDEESPTGFFGVSVDQETPFHRLFIVSSAVMDGARGRVTAQRPDGLQTGQGERVSELTGTTLERQGAVPERVLEIINCYQDEQQAQLPHRNARIGDILVSEGLVKRQQVEYALKITGKKKLGATLIELGLVSEDQLLAALAARFSIRFVDLSEITPTADALAALSPNLVNRMQILPLAIQGKTLIVASSEPTDTTTIDTLRFITNQNIEMVTAVSHQIAAAIDKYYNTQSLSLQTVLEEMEGEQPTVLEPEEEGIFIEPDSKVILLVNKILMEAYERGVSDIHFEPEMDKGPLVVRYRVDGECVLSHEIPASYKNAVVARLKIMAKLDIAERRKPQSGKIQLLFDKKRLEYRVEITPTVGGEDAVLRLLTAAKPLSLNDMGFSAANHSAFEELLKKPYGLILCVGPTGSGKTTTLHSALAVINTPDRKIWTAEDPVEIVQKRLRQVQVNTKIGFGFEEALRSFLRADPDVIMIGEMRDRETAKTAIAASLTGHLVFSTLHTNSAPETVVRLVEIGLDPFNFADALLGVMAQRLARKLCEKCKEPYQPSAEEYQEIVLQYGETWFQAHGLSAPGAGPRLMKKKGCEKCGGTGYKGRIALHELLVGTAAVKTAIKKSVSVEDLRELALQEGMRTLKMDGIQKVLQGVTDLPQILKVCIM